MYWYTRTKTYVSTLETNVSTESDHIRIRLSYCENNLLSFLVLICPTVVVFAGYQGEQAIPQYNKMACTSYIGERKIYLHINFH